MSTSHSAAQLHLIRLDGSGTVRHRAEILARRAQVAAGPEGRCAVFYDRGAQLRRGEFFITSFDATFRREWSTPVTFPAPAGGVFQFVAVRDGYIVSAHENGGLFLAKYTFDGKLLWSAVDHTRRNADFVVARGDSFYLIGAGRKEESGLHVVLGR